MPVMDASVHSRRGSNPQPFDANKQHILTNLNKNQTILLTYIQVPHVFA